MSARTLSKAGILALTACGLSACVAVSTQDRLSQDQRYRETIPVCSTPRECEAAWAGARDWVNARCGMKIQTMTDNLIETYNAIGYTPQLACRVTKTPVPTGGYQFEVDVGCANMFGCTIEPATAKQMFNDWVEERIRPFRGT